MEIQEMKREILRDEMASIIEQALLRGDLKPGDRVNESEIAQKAGVSRGPIREAIRQLVGEGILVSKPHRGTFVAQWSDREVVEIYSLRAVLEGFATGLAAQRATAADIASLQSLVEQMRACASKADTDTLAELDWDFHDKVYALSDHATLVQSLSGIARKIRLLLVIDVTVSPSYCAKVADNHQAILDALRTGDARHAETRVREHIMQVGEKLVESLRQQRSAGQKERRRPRYALPV